jgi:hypothetical protein
MALNKDKAAALNEAFQKLFSSVGVNIGTFTDFLADSNQVDAVISVPTTFYVELTGDDNNPGTQDRPFKTIQAAIDYLKGFVIKSEVTVKVGVGTFDGFIIEGIDIQNATPTGGEQLGLKVEGAASLFSVATGTNTGTITSAAVGSVYTGVVTLTDSTQTWTNDDLLGRFVYFPSTGIYHPIVANTATTVTISETTTTGMSGSAYQIITPGTNIRCNALSIMFGSAFSSSTVTGSIIVKDNIGDFLSTVPAVSIRMFDFDSMSGTGGVGKSYIHIAEAGAASIVACRFYNSTTQACVTNMAKMGYVSYCFMSINNASGSAIANPRGESGVSMVRSFVMGNSNGTGISSSGIDPNSGLVSGCFFKGLSKAVSNTTRISMVNFSSSYFLNNTTIVELGILSQINISFANGSGNTNGIVASKGARVQVNSTSVLGATNEIVLDGVNYTLADMRAASPKLLTNTYGTIVYE